MKVRDGNLSLGLESTRTLTLSLAGERRPDRRGAHSKPRTFQVTIGEYLFSLLRVVLALRAEFAAVRSVFAMRSLVFLLAGLLACAGWMHGEIKTPENAPIEITSTGQTTYENGLATARDNVAIHIGDTDIYADYAQYNSSTH